MRQIIRLEYNDIFRASACHISGVVLKHNAAPGIRFYSPLLDQPQIILHFCKVWFTSEKGVESPEATNNASNNRNQRYHDNDVSPLPDNQGL